MINSVSARPLPSAVVSFTFRTLAEGTLGKPPSAFPAGPSVLGKVCRSFSRSRLFLDSGFRMSAVFLFVSYLR